MLIALGIDFFALQELWSFDTIVAALPSHYATHRSTAQGCGTGALVGWRRSLQHPSTRPRVEYDSHDLLVALMRHHKVGFVLIASVHIHAELDYKARRTVLINLTSLAHYLRPNVEMVGGDFNMSRTNARHPLAAACRSGACMARYRPAFPADTPTHYTTSQHRHTATSIDHIFIRGARTIASADVLPSPTAHRPLVATVKPLEGLTDVRSWRHVRWRLAPKGTIPRLAALLDLLWGWLTPTLQPPLTFLRALWAAARQLIPHPSPTTHILADLRRRASPRTTADVTDLAETIAAAAARQGVDRPDVALRGTTITSATKGALARRSKPLCPYSGIQPDHRVELFSPQARIDEVRDQASATTQHRGHTTDINLLTALYDPSNWAPYFDPINQIPANLLRDMLSAGLDPRDPHHRGPFCRQLVSGPVLRDDRVWRSATSRGTLFAALDQCPQALLHHCSHGGMHGVQHQPHLLDAGADSLSLDSAMMGIDKGKAFPHLFKSHRPVTLTSPLTRIESRAARGILVPSLEVSGSYPPDVFAYRANIRPAFMALTFRWPLASSSSKLWPSPTGTRPTPFSANNARTPEPSTHSSTSPGISQILWPPADPPPDGGRLHGAVCHRGGLEPGG